MKRLALVFGIMFLMIAPAAVLAGYDYPSGGGPSMGGGGGASGGGSSGGGISIGSYPSGGGSEPSMGGDHAMGGSGDVTIVDFAFQPSGLTVDAGTTVTWRNTGGAPHTVTSFNGAFDSGTLDPGGSFSETFSDPGVYMYHCEIHPNMVGRVQVSAS